MFFASVPVMSYANQKEEDDDGEYLDGTEYGHGDEYFLFSNSAQSYDTETMQNRLHFDIA